MESIKLKPHDQVALVCPGSICRQPDHPALTQKYLKDHYQLHAIFGKDTTDSMPPSKRAEILLEYLFNQSIKLIVPLRGGEGTADMISYIHQYFEDIKTLSPKFLLGHSDFTPLLIYFEKYYHWPVIHGASPIQFAFNLVDDETRKATMDLMFGINANNTVLNDLIPLNDLARENKKIESELTGGNLSIVDVSIKDIWEIDTANKIIFFEDVGEKAHKIIRTLKYFSRIGLFESVKAMILGDFTCNPIGCDKEEQENNKQAILKTLSSFAMHHDFPVLYTNKCGHGKTNFPLIYSTPYCLQLGDNPQLKFDIFES